MKNIVVWLKNSETRNILSLLLKEEERVTDVLEEIVPDVRIEVWESDKAMAFAVEALEFEHACI